jgi:DNA-binding IclR family transcriptional regulator
MQNRDFFTNDRFKALEYMYEERGKNNFVRITQQEVASELDLSRMTVNIIFKQLKENGYIQEAGHVAKYLLTEKAMKTIEAFRLADQ